MALKFDFDKKKFLMGKYLMETFLVDLKWINYKPSVISCACVYIVMKFYKMENYLFHILGMNLLINRI